MVIVLLLAMPLITAIETEINVKTLVDHKVSIFIYPHKETNSINSFHKMTDGTGNVKVIHSSDHSKIDILIKVTKDGKTIFLERFDNGYSAGKPISLRVDYDEINGEYTGENNDDQDELTDQSDNSSDENKTEEANQSEGATTEQQGQLDNPSTTGNVVSNEEGGSILSWMSYIIIGGLILAGAIVFLIWRVSNSSFTPSPPKIAPPGAAWTNKSAMENAELSLNKENDIVILEKKLEEAQREIRLLKNKEQIKEAERKLEEDRRELERLRGGSA